jgi:putative membrane protein
MKRLCTSSIRTRITASSGISARSLLSLGVLGILTLFAVSCGNGTPDSVKEAKKDNAQNTDSMSAKASVTDSNVVSKQDAAFMVDAASGGMMEVELGHLAQTNANSQGIKDFGAMMITDHGKGGTELKSLALAKGVTLPDSISNDQKKKRDELAKKTGKNFDKAYIDYMVADHKEDISDFQKAANNANDPDIKAWFSNHLPVLQHHLDQAQLQQQRVKKM